MVVNRDTDTVVWAHDGHGREVLELFFAELTEEQCASIRVVTVAAAKWITERVEAHCPNADRCVDPFHVVEWANDAVDIVRLDAWRRARIELADLVKKSRPERKLRRVCELKEELRLVFKLTTHGAAKEYFEKWIKSARHCRIPAFVELRRKIRRHEKHILNTIEFGLGNARIEATNNKVKLLIRIAYGFWDVDTMIGLIMLFCSSIAIPWP